MKGRSIDSKDYEKLYYQLKKFEVLIKRKAGMYCYLNWRSKQIVASGEQNKKNKRTPNPKSVKEAIDLLKALNASLAKSKENLISRND